MNNANLLNKCENEEKVARVPDHSYAKSKQLSQKLELVLRRTSNKLGLSHAVRQK